MQRQYGPNELCATSVNVDFFSGPYVSEDKVVQFSRKDGAQSVAAGGTLPDGRKRVAWSRNLNGTGVNATPTVTSLLGPGDVIRNSGATVDWCGDNHVDTHVKGNRKAGTRDKFPPIVLTASVPRRLIKRLSCQERPLSQPAPLSGTICSAQGTFPRLRRTAW